MMPMQIMEYNKQRPLGFIQNLFIWILGLLFILGILVLGVPSHAAVKWLNTHLPNELQLQNPQGLWWKGRAQWPWLPGWLNWQFTPQGIWLEHPALNAPLQLKPNLVLIEHSAKLHTISPIAFMRNIMNGTLYVPAGALSVDAAVLKHFSAASSALRPAGILNARWNNCTLQMGHQRILGVQKQCQGALIWHNAQLRVSPVNPLGEYQLTWIAHNDTDELALQLHSIQGPLSVNGTGIWNATQGLHMTGQAWADASRHEQLKPLLAMIGNPNPQTMKTDWMMNWVPSLKH